MEVKVLGLLAMIDDGETDWKVMVIDVKDPQAKDLNNLEDVERLMPGFLAATRDWFMWELCLASLDIIINYHD